MNEVQRGCPDVLDSLFLYNPCGNSGKRTLHYLTMSPNAFLPCIELNLINQFDGRMIRTLFLSLSLFFFTLSPSLRAQSVGPQQESHDFYSLGLELSSTLNVLMISLQPGYEDFSALAYFKMGRGAKVMSAYVTNGEAGNSDAGYEYPSILAATRRQEASHALKTLGIEHNFLAFVGIEAVHDSARLETLWPADSLRMKLARLISGFKPDLLILTGDYELGNSSIRWKTVRRVLLEAVSSLQPPKQTSALRSAIPQFPYWSVGRVVCDDGQARGVKIPVGARHLRSNKTYEEIAETAAGHYASLRFQRAMWNVNSSRTYSVISPKNSPALSAMDQGLSPKLSQTYESLGSRIKSLAATLQKIPKGRSVPKSERAALLKSIVALIDEVDSALSNVNQLSAAERKTILGWKGDLEALRAVLLGVSLRYSLSERILTNVQLTYLMIDSISGLSKSGTTEIFFPGVDHGWIVNEWTEKRLPLEVGTAYRLLSPKSVVYNHPDHQFGTQNPSLENPFLFFIIHRSAARESTFVYRSAVDIKFAPRFNVEVLRPIVYAVDSEVVPVRLTNNSRDGVFDEYGVSEPNASSNKVAFRLSNKGDSRLDTLFLTWKELPEEGSHIIPIKIKDESVGGIVVRRFEVATGGARNVGLISPYESGPTEETLRRLKLRIRRISLASESLADIPDLDVLIVDHRALTFRQISPKQRRSIENRVRSGLHLVVLTQDASVWNRSPLVDGISLLRVEGNDEKTEVAYEPDHPFMTSPNKLTDEDWNNWIYERTLNGVDVRSLDGALTAVARSSEGNPYILTKGFGSGKVTYVNLSLHHQFINIHDGAMRILANVIFN